MFDIGFSELVVTALVALVVLGPQKLPAAVKSVATFIYRLRCCYQQATDKLVKEFNLDDAKLDAYNEQVMHNMKTKETTDNKTTNSTD